jgi:hypothetical protein
MSAQINASILKNFIVKTIGADKLAHDRAQSYGISENEYEKANENDNNYLEIDEILDNKDLYEQFATMFVEEQDKAADEKDADKEKEEKNKVKNKSGAASA